MSIEENDFLSWRKACGYVGSCCDVYLRNPIFCRSQAFRYVGWCPNTFRFSARFAPGQKADFYF